MILLGILAAGLGIAIIVFRDFFWELTRLGNQFEGEKSERTELWDTGQILSGLVLIGIGAIVICSGLAEAQTEARENAEATGTATTALVDLDTTFASYISEWQSYDGDETISVNPRSLNIQARRILYGRCGTNTFYLYVIGYKNEQYNDYAYLSDSFYEPSRCAPWRASIWSDEPIGGGWYDISASGSLDNFGTPTATFALPTARPTQTPMVVIVTATPESEDAPTATPTQTPIYIVVTATPVEEAEEVPEATEAQ